MRGRLRLLTFAVVAVLGVAVGAVASGAAPRAASASTARVTVGGGHDAVQPADTSRGADASVAHRDAPAGVVAASATSPAASRILPTRPSASTSGRSEIGTRRDRAPPG